METSFIEDYAKANKLKASGLAAKQTVLEKHLVPVLGKKRSTRSVTTRCRR